MQRPPFNENQLAQAAAKGILFPTVTPLFKSPPNQGAINDWVQRLQQVHPLMGDVARIYGEHIEYIPYETFLDQLKQSIHAFLQHSPHEPYVLWIAQKDQYILSQGCSDQWVAGLALEHAGLRFPEAILTTDELTNYLAEHPEIKTVLAVDDAAYSGKHISQQLSALLIDFYRYSLSNDDFYEIKSALNILIAIPFQTARATQLMQDMTKNQLTITILPHRPIAVIEDHLNEEQLEFITKCRVPFSQKLSLTYFDHCMPDFMSTAPILGEPLSHVGAKGYLAGTEELMWLMGYWNSYLRPRYNLSAYRADTETIDTPEEWNKLYDAIPTSSDRLVPLIIRPYRLHTETHYKKLQVALANNELGKYRNNDLPERYTEARKILQAEKGYTPTLFQPAINPNESQYAKCTLRK